MLRKKYIKPSIQSQTVAFECSLASGSTKMNFTSLEESELLESEWTEELIEKDLLW